MHRRHLLARGLALVPLAAAASSLLLAGCGSDDESWAEGMLPIKWDRDPCARCGMIISDRRFAAQVRGGPANTAFKFDDIGCALSFCADKLKQHPWLTDAATRIWVADGAGQGRRWLDARRAHYAPGPRSPMGYDLLASAAPQPGSQPFEPTRDKVADTWPANCKTPQAQAPTEAQVSGGTPARTP